MQGRILKMVSESEIKSTDAAYHTMRQLDGGGSVRVLVLKKDMLARVEYDCPNCKKEGYLETVWKRPFSFKCEGCGKTINVPKLKGKKEKAKAP